MITCYHHIHFILLAIMYTLLFPFLSIFNPLLFLWPFTCPDIFFLLLLSFMELIFIVTYDEINTTCQWNRGHIQTSHCNQSKNREEYKHLVRTFRNKKDRHYCDIFLLWFVFVCLGFFTYGVELGFFQLMNKVKWHPKEIYYEQRWRGSMNCISIQQQDLSRNVWPISHVPCLFNKTAQKDCSEAVSQHNQESEYYPYSSWTGHEITHFEKKDIVRLWWT